MAETNDRGHTAAYRIFRYFYQCYIPQSHLYSRDYLKQCGIPTTGNKQIDRELANSRVLSQLTIAQMAQYFNDGASMTLYDPQQSVEIYKTIREHLMDCKRQAESSVGGVSGPPIEDLRMLDDLAAEVYKIAKGYMEHAPEDSQLFSRLAQLGGRRAMRREEKLPETRKVAEEHVSISETIAKLSFERGKSWR